MPNHKEKEDNVVFFFLRCKAKKEALTILGLHFPELQEESRKVISFVVMKPLLADVTH